MIVTDHLRKTHRQGGKNSRSMTGFYENRWLMGQKSYCIAPIENDEMGATLFSKAPSDKSRQYLSVKDAQARLENFYRKNNGN